MRRWMVGLAIAVVASVLFLLWRLLTPSDILEVRARILPPGWQRCSVTDLDGDGNDEIVVETDVKGWGLFTEPKTAVTAVTMREGQFVTFPIPLSNQVRTSMPKGRRLIGETERGDVAVAERLPNGKWQVQVLLPKAMHGAGLNDYTVGDLDGSGHDDDIVVLAGSRGERVLWFRRLPDGRWMKGSEIVLPTGKGQGYGGPDITAYGVETRVWIGNHPFRLPLLFWDGRWEVGQLDERVHLFEGDLDGDGLNEKVLARFFADKVRWRVRSRKFGLLKGTWDFKVWKVLNAAATDKFGDGRWHLLLAMVKAPLTMRVVDCYFEPSKGWKISEVCRWQIVKVMPWHPPQVPNYANLKIGDTDGDGQAEIIIGSKHGCWLLRQARQKWAVQPLQFKKGQTLLEHFPIAQIGNRVWFSRTFFEWVKTPSGIFGEHLTVAELGTFNAQGRWQPIGRYQRLFFDLPGSFFDPPEAWPWLEDLDDDRYPELLTYKGLIWTRPTLYYRSREGQWRKANLAGGSLARQLNVFLKEGPDVGPNPNDPFFVRWDGKNWFVIVWNDGFVQAITLKKR